MSALGPAPHNASVPADHGTSGAPAVLVRAMDGRITLWSPAMKQRYGFTSEQAQGQVAHQLLRTIFWQPLQDVEAVLLDQKFWSGGLIHLRSDGHPVMTAHYWHLHIDVTGSKPMVTELHSDIMPAGETAAGQLADVMAIVAHELSQPMTAIGAYINAAHGLMQTAWLDRERLSQALTGTAKQVDRVKQRMAEFRAAAEALRRASGNAVTHTAKQRLTDER